MASARYHLGIDCGTCWSKLVLRDYQSRVPTAHVVHPRTRGWFGRKEQDYRIPSGIAFDGTSLYFGYEGATRQQEPRIRYYRSVKMRGAFPQGYFGAPIEAPQGLTDFDLCALVVLHLIQIGWAAAKARAGIGSTPKISMTLGVPMSLIGDEATRGRFVELARIAWVLYRSGAPDLSRCLRVDDAKALVAAAREEVAKRGPAASWRDWVRSEAEAGVLWAFRSPTVGTGLYACTDVGAGTTDVSFFRIGRVHDPRAGWFKGQIAFYSAVSDVPGMDAIRAELAACRNTRDDRIEYGREDEMLRALPAASLPRLQATAERMFVVHQNAWRLAFGKEIGQSRWNDWRMFLLGGGSHVSLVAETLRQKVWPHIPPSSTVSAGVPTDLVDGSRAVSAAHAPFLLVAYGLSFPDVEVPVATGPNDVAPLALDGNPRHVDQDELYPR